MGTVRVMCSQACGFDKVFFKSFTACLKTIYSCWFLAS